MELKKVGDTIWWRGSNPNEPEKVIINTVDYSDQNKRTYCVTTIDGTNRWIYNSDIVYSDPKRVPKFELGDKVQFNIGDSKSKEEYSIAQINEENCTYELSMNQPNLFKEEELVLSDLKEEKPFEFTYQIGNHFKLMSVPKVLSVKNISSTADVHPGDILRLHSFRYIGDLVDLVCEEKQYSITIGKSSFKDHSIVKRVPRFKFGENVCNAKSPEIFRIVGSSESDFTYCLQDSKNMVLKERFKEEDLYLAENPVSTEHISTESIFKYTGNWVTLKEVEEAYKEKFKVAPGQLTVKAPITHTVTYSQGDTLSEKVAEEAFGLNVSKYPLSSEFKPTPDSETYKEGERFTTQSLKVKILHDYSDGYDSEPYTVELENKDSFVIHANLLPEWQKLKEGETVETICAECEIIAINAKGCQVRFANGLETLLHKNFMPIKKTDPLVKEAQRIGAVAAKYICDSGEVTAIRSAFDMDSLKAKVLELQEEKNNLRAEKNWLTAELDSKTQKLKEFSDATLTAKKAYDSVLEKAEILEKENSKLNEYVINLKKAIVNTEKNNFFIENKDLSEGHFVWLNYVASILRGTNCSEIIPSSHVGELIKNPKSLIITGLEDNERAEVLEAIEKARKVYEMKKILKNAKAHNMVWADPNPNQPLLFTSTTGTIANFGYSCGGSGGGGPTTGVNPTTGVKGGPNESQVPKFRYQDRVKVSDPNSFWFGKEGTVENYDEYGTKLYTVTELHYTIGTVNARATFQVKGSQLEKI